MDIAFAAPGLDVRFNFHSPFPFFEIDCGERRRLPIQAKRECEIAGWEKCFFAPPTSLRVDLAQAYRPAEKGEVSTF